jgi:hypothetical protein
VQLRVKSTRKGSTAIFSTLRNCTEGSSATSPDGSSATYRKNSTTANLKKSFVLQYKIHTLSTVVFKTFFSFELLVALLL